MSADCIQIWNRELMKHEDVPVAHLSNDDLISEYGQESWAADRCVGTKEHEESGRCLRILRAELLRRMGGAA